MPESRPLRVAIESPYSGDVAANLQFARNVCHHAVTHGYNPYAMHLFFTQFLNDDLAEERRLGIACGLAWTDLVNEVWFCLRPGDTLSRGMTQAFTHHEMKPATSRPRLRLLYFTQDGALMREGSADELTQLAADSR